MTNTNLKITDIKVVDETTLYKFNDVLWANDCLRVNTPLGKEDVYIRIDKQHGDYFEIGFLKDDFELAIGDDLQIVAQAYIDMLPKDYNDIIVDLVSIEGQNKPQKYYIDSNNQTCYIECTDEQWSELFKTADKNLINTNIDSKHYNHFYSEKYVRIVRVEKEFFAE
jgi:hypothetical protein